MASSTPELGTEALVYIEKVRRATKRFAEQGADDVRSTLEAVRGTSHFNVEAPTASARREVELMKTGVKRLSAWYLRYLSAQLDAFAGDMVRVAEALSVRTERLESGTDELIVRLGAVEERLDQLEAAGRKAAAPPAAPSASKPSASKPSAPAPAAKAPHTTSRPAPPRKP
jgi:hypothetical protein